MGFYRDLIDPLGLNALCEEAKEAQEVAIKNAKEQAAALSNVAK